MAKDVQINIKVNADTSKVDALNNSVDTTSKKLNETKGNLDGVTGLMDKFTGGAASKFEEFTGGLSKVASGFSGIGTAIAASGLGVLTLVISSIIEAFKSSEEGQHKFAAIMQSVSMITRTLTEVLADLGKKLISIFENPKKALTDFANGLKENIINRFNGLLELIPALGNSIKLLFEGKWSEAAKVAVDATAKVGLGVDHIVEKTQAAIDATGKLIDKLNEQAKRGQEIAEEKFKLEEKERDLITAKATAETNIALLREKAVQKSKYDLQERIGFYQQAANIEDKIAKQEVDNAKLKKKIFEDEYADKIKAKTLTSEQKNEEANLTADIIKLAGEEANVKTKLLKRLEALRAEEAADKQAKIDEEQKQKDAAYKLEQQRLKESNAAELKSLDVIDAAKEANRLNTLTEQQKEIEIVKNGYKEKLDNAKKFGQDAEAIEIEEMNKINDINLKYQKIDTDNKQAEADKQKAIAQAKVDFELEMADKSGEAIGIVGGLLKKGSDAAKAAALIQIGVGTATGFIKGLNIAQSSADALGPGAVYAFPLFYAEQVISVLGAAAKAKEVLGSGGSTPSAPTIAKASAPLQPKVSLVGNANQGNNVTGPTDVNKLNAQQPLVVHAIVSETQITTAQANVNKMKASAEL